MTGLKLDLGGTEVSRLDLGGQKLKQTAQRYFVGF